MCAILRSKLQVHAEYTQSRYHLAITSTPLEAHRHAAPPTLQIGAFRKGPAKGHKRLWWGDAPDYESLDVYIADVKSFIFDRQRCYTA